MPSEFYLWGCGDPHYAEPIKLSADFVPTGRRLLGTAEEEWRTDCSFIYFFPFSLPYSFISLSSFSAPSTLSFYSSVFLFTGISFTIVIIIFNERIMEQRDWWRNGLPGLGGEVLPRNTVGLRLLPGYWSPLTPATLVGQCSGFVSFLLLVPPSLSLCLRKAA